MGCRCFQLLERAEHALEVKNLRGRKNMPRGCEYVPFLHHSANKAAVGEMREADVVEHRLEVIEFSFLVRYFLY